jgi:hypothetical protein
MCEPKGKGKGKKAHTDGDRDYTGCRALDDLEAEVERLTAELAEMTRSNEHADDCLENVRAEREYTVKQLRAQLADIKQIVDEADPTFFEENALGNNWYERLVEASRKGAAPPAAPALNVSCITCVSGPRVKGKVVDSCQRYSMADQCYDHGFPAYTAAPNAPSPVVRVPVGCVREAPGNEVDGKAAAAVIPIAEALKQQDEFVKRQQQKEKDYWNRDDVCECGCVHSINGYCTDCGKAKGIAMNTFFIKTLARHEKNVATWGHQDLNTLIIATGEEFGELCKASLGNEGESHDIKKETIDLAALLVEIYEWFGGEQ